MDYCFGKRLKEARQKNNKTQRDIAVAANISPQMISAYEKQERKPSIDVAAELAKALDVSLDYLCGIERDASCGQSIKTCADAIKHIAELAKYFDCTCEIVERPLPEDCWDCVQIGPDEYEEITTYDETAICINDSFISGFIRRWSEIYPLYRKGVISKELMDNWYEGELERLGQLRMARDTPRHTQWFDINPVQKSQHKK